MVNSYDPLFVCTNKIKYFFCKNGCKFKWLQYKQVVQQIEWNKQTETNYRINERVVHFKVKFARTHLENPLLYRQDSYSEVLNSKQVSTKRWSFSIRSLQVLASRNPPHRRQNARLPHSIHTSAEANTAFLPLLSFELSENQLSNALLC